jgi:hypothetical protein
VFFIDPVFLFPVMKTRDDNTRNIPDRIPKLNLEGTDMDDIEPHCRKRRDVSNKAKDFCAFSDLFAIGEKLFHFALQCLGGPDKAFRHTICLPYIFL